MLTYFFKSFMEKYNQNFKSIANSKTISILACIKKAIAFCFYWVAYYSINDTKQRTNLFSKLLKIKEFKQFYFCNN
jgi:hypothetical protein